MKSTFDKLIILCVCLMSLQFSYGVKGPNPTIVANPFTILDCEITSIELFVEPIESNVEYQWIVNNDTINAFSITVDTPGEIILIATDTIIDCFGTDIVYIADGVNYPVVLIASNNGTELNAEINSIELYNKGTQGSDYQAVWEFDGKQILSNSLIVTEPGTYNLVVTDLSNGCSNSESITITSNYNLLIPGIIHAENFSFKFGATVNNTNEEQFLEFLNIGDYVEYLVKIETTGEYNVVFRTASESNIGGLKLKLFDQSDNVYIEYNLSFEPTGFWEVWQETSETLFFAEGEYNLKFLITQPNFNLDWVKFDLLTSNLEIQENTEYKLYPNPSSSFINIQSEKIKNENFSFKVFDSNGKTQLQSVNLYSPKSKIKLNIESLKSGLYFLEVSHEKFRRIKKFVVIK